jgi:probable F420-dependent oxidoreductase
LTNKTKFGLFVRPVRDLMTVSEFAKKAEGLEFDSLWSGEHLAFYTPTFDSLTLMAVCAGATKKIELGTAILLMPLRHPAWVQKSLTTLDYASGGRSILGIGIGGAYEKEFETVNVPVRERGARTDEGLELLKKLMTENNVTYNGKFYQVNDLTMEPKPIRKPHPPIHIAGNSEAALKRTVRFGDGWMPILLSLDIYKETTIMLENLAHKANRDPNTIERDMFIYISMDKSYEKALDTAKNALGNMYSQSGSALETRAIVGTPSQCLERLSSYSDLGVQHFIFHWACKPQDIPWHMDTLSADIIPKLRT